MDDLGQLESGSNLQADLEAGYQSDLLRKSLELLTPRQKAVVVARIYEDLPFAQISEAIGCSVNAAKVHFHEGKKRIAVFMKGQVGEYG